MSINITFSRDLEEQKAVSKAGGYIVLAFRNEAPPIFRFDTREQYKHYLSLKRKSPKITK